MLTWLKKEIYFLESKREKWLFIAIFFIFGILFINLFEPFNIYSWSNFKNLNKSLILSLYILPCCAAIIFSQFLVRRLLKDFKFTILKLILWISFEILLVTLLNIYFFGDPNTPILSELPTGIYHTSLGMLICYFISYSILQSSTKKEFYVASSNEHLISIKDYKEDVKITLDFNCILYVKSIENYVQIFYLLNDIPKNIMIRNTLKNIELTLKPYDILRSQRSYLVNRNQISSIEKQNKKFIIQVNTTEEEISLSNSFLENFKDLFTENK